ncbi:hypothetical protein BG51_08255 [Pseudomonas [fluorescens] ATCC 17400]
MSNIGSVSGYNFQPYEGVGYKEKDIARPNKLDLTAGEDAQVLDPRTGTWGPAVAADEGQQRDPGEPIDVEFVYDSKTGEYVLAKPVDPLIDLKHGQLIDVEIPHDPTGSMVVLRTRTKPINPLALIVLT